MLEVNGRKYIRVSEIAGQLIDFSHISKEVLENKAALGTRVHECIHQEIQGNFPIVDRSSKESGYFNSFKGWEEMARPQFICSEVRYCCEEKRLTGCVDALIKIEGEKEAVLVDFKTSAQESPISWPVQAHLYYYLLRRSNQQIANKFIFIKLDRYGYLPNVYEYKYDQSLMERCLQMVDDAWKEKAG